MKAHHKVTRDLQHHQSEGTAEVTAEGTAEGTWVWMIGSVHQVEVALPAMIVNC